MAQEASRVDAGSARLVRMIGTRAPSYKLDVQGAIAAGTSDIYFTHTAHEHVGRGNVDGHAAIENASTISEKENAERRWPLARLSR